MPPSTIFTIAPGAPFLRTFVGALLDGRIVEGFSRALPPLSMADATIYVPTRRAARSLTARIRLCHRSSCLPLLPRILPLGALDATETALLLRRAGRRGAFGRRSAASGERNLAAHASRPPDLPMGAGAPPRDRLDRQRRHEDHRSARSLVSSAPRRSTLSRSPAISPISSTN